MASDDYFENDNSFFPLKTICTKCNHQGKSNENGFECAKCGNSEC